MDDFTNFIITFFDLSFNFLNDENDDQDYLQTLNQSMDTYYDELFRCSENALRINLNPTKDTATGSVCVICYEEIEKEDETYPLPCGDVFHRACLEDAIKRNHDRCPVCSSKLPIRPKTPDLSAGESDNRSAHSR